MSWTKADVIEIVPLTNTIVKLILEPEIFFAYVAGQYLQMRVGQHLSYFSIANAPLGSKRYELHIRHEKDHASSQTLLADIQALARVDLHLPLGHCHLGNFDSSRPLIFIAGGTGFAPIKAVIEYMLYTDDPREFEFYWLSKQTSDLYWQQALKEWRQHVPNFKHLGFYAGKNLETLVKDLKTRHGQELKNYQFMLAGAFEMVYRCRDTMLKWGVKKDQLFSDAFEFEN